MSKELQINEFKKIIDNFKKTEKFKELVKSELASKPKLDLTLIVFVSKYHKKGSIGWIFANDDMKKKGFSAIFEKPSNQLETYYEII
jgi:hypothetical protein